MGQSSSKVASEGRLPSDDLIELILFDASGKGKSGIADDDIVSTSEEGATSN